MITTSAPHSRVHSSPRDGDRPGSAVIRIFDAQRANGDWSCPWCGHSGSIGWGTSRGRTRRRCRSCRRTFSTFTGTPLARLKRIELWSGFCGCMARTRTVRRTGRAVGINKDTALRWRHRLNTALRDDEPRLLGGRVLIGQMAVPFSEKGKRHLGRPARKRGPWVGTYGVPAVGILLAQQGAAPRRFVMRAIPRAPYTTNFEQQLFPLIAPGATVICGRSDVLGAARRSGILARRFPPGPGSSRHAVYWRGRDLKGWLGGFRGVATRYLPGYLAWFRFELDPACSSSMARRGYLYLGRFP